MNEEGEGKVHGLGEGRAERGFEGKGREEIGKGKGMAREVRREKMSAHNYGLFVIVYTISFSTFYLNIDA